jgi:hypothetical protein
MKRDLTTNQSARSWELVELDTPFRNLTIGELEKMMRISRPVEMVAISPPCANFSIPKNERVV